MNATCINLPTRYGCFCRRGFQGNGVNCTGLSIFFEKEKNSCKLNKKWIDDHFSFFFINWRFVIIYLDVDECATRGGEFGNHCRLNEKCENTIGSYVCNKS